MIGRTISHYQIVERLGEGGMGVVYKAHDSHLDRFVALKLLPPVHPNIVTIYDIDQHDGADYIAIEYIPGRTLDQLTGRKGLNLSDALKYGVQVADALSRTHAAT